RVPGLRHGHFPRPLVPGPHRHAHPRLRRRLARGVLPGQLPRIRGRQEAPPGRRGRGAAPPALQGTEVMGFVADIRRRWTDANTMVCVGLDPEPAKFPAHLQADPDGVFTFCKTIVDATADVSACFKPQIAHFAALGAELALARLIRHIHDEHPGVPVILDAKRGDIGSTAQHYASEAFDRYAADAVTLNPYLGRDSVQPFLDRADKGVVLLCRTSNPGAKDFQDLDCGG